MEYPQQPIVAVHSYSQISPNLEGAFLSLPKILKRGSGNRHKLKTWALDTTEKGKHASCKSLDLNEVKNNLRDILKNTKTDPFVNQKSLSPLQKDDIRITNHTETSQQQQTNQQTRIHTSAGQSPFIGYRKRTKKMSPRPQSHQQQSLFGSKQDKVPLFSVKLLKAMIKNNVSSRKTSPLTKKNEEQSMKMQEQKQKQIKTLEVQLTNTGLKRAYEKPEILKRNNLHLRRGSINLSHNMSSTTLQTLVRGHNTDKYEANLMEASAQKYRYTSVHALRQDNNLTPWE